MTPDQTFVFALKREVDKADAMHLASLKTAEKLAEDAVTKWCTNQSSAADIMQSIITWSRAMQTALKTRTDLPSLPS